MSDSATQKTGIKAVDALAELLADLKRLRALGQSPQPIWTAMALESAAGDAVLALSPIKCSGCGAKIYPVCQPCRGMDGT